MKVSRDLENCMVLKLRKFPSVLKRVLGVGLTLYCGYHVVVGGLMLAALVLVENGLIDGNVLTLSFLGRSMDGNDESARGILYEMAGRSFLLGMGRFVLLGGSSKGGP